MLTAVRRFDPATSDINELKRLLTFSTKFVNSLHLEQLPSHLDLQIIFEAMRRCVSDLLLSTCRKCSPLRLRCLFVLMLFCVSSQHLMAMLQCLPHDSVNSIK